MLRLFTGLEIPSDIKFELDMMKGGVLGARWIERDNYHLTLRFIGDVEEGLARDLAEALDAIAVPSFVTRLKGLGAFGGAKPHALYVNGDEPGAEAAAGGPRARLPAGGPGGRNAQVHAARDARPAQAGRSRRRAALYRGPQPV
jgi:hypothetical protein